MATSRSRRAALAQQAWGDRLVLPAWPYSVDDVADAIDRQLRASSGGGRRAQTLIRLIDGLGDRIAGVDLAVARRFAHAVTALADRRWERLPAPGTGGAR